MQMKATELMPGPRNLRYEDIFKECGLTTPETRRLGVKRCLRFSNLKQVNELEDMTSP